MRRLAALAALATILALSGCGSGDTTDDDSLDTGASTTDPDEPISGLPGEPPGELGEPELVEPQPGAVDPTPIPFESAEPERDDEASLRVRYTTGVPPCTVLDRVEVDETDGSVTLTVYVGADPDMSPAQVCIELAREYETIVELGEPLGDREVVDGAT